MNLTKDKLHITGMHCGGCKNRVSTVLNKLQGVRSANVSIENKEAVVEYDGDQTNFGQLKEAIEKAGYQAEKK